MTLTQQVTTSNRNFLAMLRAANNLGCQIQPSPSKPSILRGFCPFHNADSLGNAKTLMVNIVTTRFWCINCPAKGNPIAFLARTWHVTARDARILLDAHPDAGADRPPYPEDHTKPSAQGQPTSQNTAILTRAAHFYSTQLYKHYDSLHYLARLGVHPEAAAAHGIGYCNGEGLREYLLNTGVTHDEADQSPLFQSATGLEIFTGRLILADQDYTGATMWITSFPTEQPTHQYTWKASTSPTMGLPGRKPYLFNIATLDQPAHDAVLTDDQRLYISLRTAGHPVILITQRRRDEMDLDHHVERIAETLTTKTFKSIHIAMHDRALRDKIKNALAKSPKAPEQIQTKTRNHIMSYLHLGTRDLNALIAPEQPPQPETPPLETPQPETPHLEADPHPHEQDQHVQDAQLQQDQEQPDILQESDPLPEDPGEPETL